MRLDVVFTPVGLTPADVAGRTVFVIDVLRATTTMCAALKHGARAIIPVSSPEEALRLQQTIGADEVVLAGERNCVPIPGFQLGNSPLEMTTERVGGKLVVVTTTNGTQALLAVQAAGTVFIAAAANLSVVGARAEAAWSDQRDVLIVCAGRENAFALEDAYTAGRLAVAAMGGRRLRRGLNDAALACVDLVRRYGDRWERPLAVSRAGRDLIGLGLGHDVKDSARQDAYPVLAQYHDRRVALVPGA